MKRLLILLAIAISGTSFAQVGVSAGTNVLKGFGKPRPWAGVHLGLEIPRDDAVSIYGRVSHYLKQENQESFLTTATARDFSTTPFTVSVEGLSSMNYTILEGGTRYYLGDGYDFGWAAYGGSNMMLIFNKVTTQYSGYDETLYELQEGSDRTGSIISFGFGLGGGLKYSMEEVGTFYFDAVLNYVIFGQASNTMATTQFNPSGGLYSPLIFTFNLGFRKDLNF